METGKNGTDPERPVAVDVLGTGELLDLTRKIKRKGKELGFAAVGIAPASLLTPEGERLALFLARGYHGEMDWLAQTREKRADVDRVMPGAASVITAAMNYYAEETARGAAPLRGPDQPETGRISCYAWGEDYHEIVAERLRELFAWVQALLPGVQGKVYVDTGPVMEKAWAARSGIGWIGKHTNLITRELGSYVFLGVILLDRELIYDVPIEDYCGTCTRCIEACPTQAIVAPYVLDARRCISYLTIEKRGEMPEEFHAAMGDWIFGCDVCQEVCPWNRFAQPSPEPAFQPRPENRAPILSELLRLTPEEFSTRARRSPLKRAKHQGLRRNVAIALANRRKEEAGEE
ncbi:MAG: tRNA epoxyqueuosine(34) reductase QueG [Candidatus Tectomicrobia bacterium]|uniref:Epoxyqueuosine reductase n=1 Tax=Tectimicrobiota bacterium TaxID=2528274 RepID=A0A932GMS3_UNCTE|nr:tRNA epoxyqueuosine(34) reductase QueG [Candidatus Tectomicrobia bacterium]